MLLVGCVEERGKGGFEENEKKGYDVNYDEVMEEIGRGEKVECEGEV